MTKTWRAPLTSGYHHINVLGRYHFSLPETVARGEFRPLRDPAKLDEEDLLVTSPDADDF